MVVVRSWVALVLVVAASCGRFSFDPSVDATSDAAVLPSVQAGRARLAQGSSTLEAVFGSVDLDHSLLTFSLAVVDGKPDDIKVTGTFIATDRIRFEREGTQFAIDIRWTVVTWNRMTVRRGEQAFANSLQLTALIDPPVDVARSFAIATHRDSGPVFMNDEYIEVQVVGPTQLLAQTRAANSQTARLAWQVVELDDGVVHHGTALLGPGTTVTEVVIPPVEPGRSWLVYSHSASGNAPPEAQHQAVAGRIVDGTRIAFERGGGAGTAHISWSVVELATGTVERGVASFADGATQVVEAVTLVDPTRAFVFGGSFAGTSGRTTSIDPGPGRAWATAELALTTLDLRRGISTGTTSFPWSVITLE